MELENLFKPGCGEYCLCQVSNTLTFEFDPKLDCFIPLPYGTFEPVCSKIGSSIWKYRMHKFDLFGFVRPWPLTYWVLTPKFIVSYSCPTKHLCRFPSKLVRSVTRIILYTMEVAVQQLYVFLSASLYFSKRGAYWDRLCRDVVGHWLSRACTVAKRCILGL